MTDKAASPRGRPRPPPSHVAVQDNRQDTDHCRHQPRPDGGPQGWRRRRRQRPLVWRRRFCNTPTINTHHQHARDVTYENL